MDEVYRLNQYTVLILQMPYMYNLDRLVLQTPQFLAPDVVPVAHHGFVFGISLSVGIRW